MIGRGRLRIGVVEGLLELAPIGGHGKVWHRVLGELRQWANLVPVDARGQPPRSRRWPPPAVILADGHGDLPPARRPLVVQVHEAGWFEPQLRACIDPAFLAHIAVRTERALRRAGQVIVPSQAIRRDLIDRFALAPESVHAIPHGVDEVFRSPALRGREIVARRRGGAPTPYVLYAASLHPRKNLALLRQAMVQVAAHGLPHVLAIAASPAPDRLDSSQLERAAREPLPGFADRVVWLPQPSDEELAALMAEADVFCLPSLYEGFGLTALEAMACGTAVLVSDRGALPEVVGQAGVVSEPTAAALSSALIALLKDGSRRRELGAAARARAAQFTWRATAAGWLQVLSLAAARGRRSYTGPR